MGRVLARPALGATQAGTHELLLSLGSTVLAGPTARLLSPSLAFTSSPQTHVGLSCQEELRRCRPPSQPLPAT